MLGLQYMNFVTEDYYEKSGPTWSLSGADILHGISFISYSVSFLKNLDTSRNHIFYNTYTRDHDRPKENQVWMLNS